MYVCVLLVRPRLGMPDARSQPGNEQSPMHRNAHVAPSCRRAIAPATPLSTLGSA